MGGGKRGERGAEGAHRKCKQPKLQARGRSAKQSKLWEDTKIKMEGGHTEAIPNLAYMVGSMHGSLKSSVTRSIGSWLVLPYYHSLTRCAFGEKVRMQRKNFESYGSRGH